MLSAMTATEARADKSVIHRTDSVTVRSWNEVNARRQQATSAFPVKLQVKGRSLRVQSQHQQVLPIYTQSGSLYMNMQLSRGVNWINGLPRGRYRINNQTIRIS